MRVLITGISSYLGRLVARAALHHRHQVIGIDRRPWPDAPKAIDMHAVDLTKRPAEDVFRTRRPDAVVHLATVSHVSRDLDARMRMNLLGTRVVFEHADKYGVSSAVFVGRHTFYGASPDEALYHVEADPPLAVATFPELADLVAADLFAGSALWQMPKLRTVILRLCYTLGPSRKGTLANFLEGRRVPMALGFDPLFQVMHEEDAARAIVSCLDAGLRGVFNVAGPPPLPLSLLVRLAGRKALALPEQMYPWAFGRFGLPRLAPGAINHIKHPIVVDDAAFRAATGFTHTMGEEETLASYRWA